MSEVINVHIDVETRSPIDLFKTGSARYFEDFQLLMVRWVIEDDEEVERWWPHEGPMPRSLARLFENPRVIFWAQNATFEWECFNAMGHTIPFERMRCTQVMAQGIAIPANLAGMSEVLRLGSLGKMSEGKSLIQLFCKPKRGSKPGHPVYNDWNSHPKEWAAFDKYCEFDVRAERAAHRKMKRFPFPDWLWRQWFVSRAMAERGAPIDLELVRNAMQFDAEAKAVMKDEMISITGLANPNSGPQLLPWLIERGYPATDLTKDSVAKALTAAYPNEELPRVLRLRQKVSRTSASKFKKYLECVCKDSRVRGLQQFLGASRTGRDAGRLVQVQNLPGCTIEDLELAVELMRAGQFDALHAFWEDPTEITKSLIRPAIHAPAGKLLRVADLSAIENVVIGWLADEPTILELHRAGLDPYKVFAADAYSLPYEEVTAKQRKFAKAPVLACGFRMGGGKLKKGVRTGLWAYALSMGVDMERTEAHRLVKAWRAAHPNVCALWPEIEGAFRAAMKGETVELGPITFSWQKPFVKITLPSGRELHYCKPQIKRIVAPWWDEDEHEADEEPEMIDAIHYLGITDGVWGWIGAHGGKLIENIVQAIARDILYDGLERADGAGFELIASVHDEAVSMTDEDSELDHVVLSELMTIPPTWAPDMPLRAAGWSGTHYKKD